MEYKECIESYRHAVTTIWQHGTVVAAISGGLFAYSGAKEENSSMTPIMAIIPLIVWCFGLYWPLNRYAELKRDNLVRIERTLSKAVQDLDMRHFTDYATHRRADLPPVQDLGSFVRFEWGRIKSGRFFPLRIVELVTLSGLALLLVEVLLAVTHFVQR